MPDFKKMAKELVNFVPKLPYISEKERHEEAIRILEEKRRLTRIPESERAAHQELSRLLLITGTMLVSVDKQKRQQMIEELALALFHEGHPMKISKDVVAVLRSGMNCKHLTSGNYQVHEYGDKVVYSYWGSQLVEVDIKNRRLTLLAEPAVVTASRFMKTVMKAYEVEPPKSLEKDGQFDIPKAIRPIEETLGV